MSIKEIRPRSVVYLYRVAKIGDVRQKIESIVKEVKWLNRTMNEIRSVCEEE